MNRRVNNVLAVAAIFATALGMTICVGVWIPGIDIAFYLLVGWVPFLHRVLPSIHMRWDSMASTAIYAVAFLIGCHLFLRWLHREMRPVGQRWRLRWTAGGFLVVLLAFASGIAMVGVVHQTGWLINSPKPLYHRSHEPVNRVTCESNLRQIGQALQMYANENGGRLPDDFTTLFLEEDLTPSVFNCPSSNDLYEGTSLQEQAENLKRPGHCSYLYFGKGLSLPVADDRILALEPPEDHQNEGINILYGDGHVDWVPAPQAQELFAKTTLNLAATAAASQPATAPTTQR